MKKLDPDWLTGNLNDHEISVYRFLDYVQSLYTDLQQMQLFPGWEESYAEYQSLKKIRTGIQRISGLLPSEMTGFSTDPPEIFYRYPKQPGQQETESILQRLDFAIPVLRKFCQQAESDRKKLQADIEFGPAGIHVSNRNEGFLFTVNPGESDVWSWYYSCSLQQGRKAYTAIRTRLAGKFRYSITGGLSEIRDASMEKCGIRSGLVSTWLVRAKWPMPVVATLKPLGVLLLAEELGLE